ncbi:MAG: acyltransferase [Sedimentisphaerales bacterium]
MSGEKDVVSSRLQYIDNLKVLLTVLVILHHAIITYGAPGSWYYKESNPGPITFAFFTLFVATNQAFFMGMFFMFGGFFTPSSYDRKGMAQFLKDRFMRLGIPIIFYTLFIHPFTLLLLRVSVWHFRGNSTELMRQFLQDCNGFHVGPLWFTQNLLLFVTIYVVYQQIAVRRNQNVVKVTRKPTTAKIIFFIVALSLVTFLVRLYFPVGRFTDYFNVQFGHFSQYVALFIVGIVAYHRGWLTEIPLSLSKVWFGVVLLFIIFNSIFILAGASDGNIQPYLGGLSWQALVAAVWEQFVGVSMIIALLSLFYNKFNYQGKLLKTLASSCYTVYIIHPVILVIITIVIKDFSLHPAMKFFVLGILSVPVCFALGCLIKKLPLAKRIL